MPASPSEPECSNELLPQRLADPKSFEHRRRDLAINPSALAPSELTVQHSRCGPMTSDNRPR